jgi:thioredoxin-related protein
MHLTRAEGDFLEYGTISSSMKKKCIYGLAILFTLLILVNQVSFSQIKLVTFQQLDSLQNIQKKPVAVFIHTSWCKFCGTMKNTTLKNREVVNFLNQKYYFISLDIEEKRNINFRGYKFKYKPTGANTGVHELAEQLGTINGEIAYPSICFLNSNYEIIYQKEGYVSVKDFLTILSILKNDSNQQNIKK